MRHDFQIPRFANVSSAQFHELLYCQWAQVIILIRNVNVLKWYSTFKSRKFHERYSGRSLDFPFIATSTRRFLCLKTSFTVCLDDYFVFTKLKALARLYYTLVYFNAQVVCRLLHIDTCSVFTGEPTHFKQKHDLYVSRGLCSFGLFIKAAGLHFDIF